MRTEGKKGPVPRAAGSLLGAVAVVAAACNRLLAAAAEEDASGAVLMPRRACRRRRELCSASSAGTKQQLADAAAAALPRNAFNGLMGVFNNAAVGTPAVTVTGAPNGLAVCLGQVPGKAARQLDVQLDDGVVGTGSVRATLGVSGTNTNPGTAAAAAYNDDQQYTVCKTL